MHLVPRNNKLSKYDESSLHKGHKMQSQLASWTSCMPLENLKLAARMFDRASRRLQYNARRLEQGARSLGHLPAKDYKGAVPAVALVGVA